MNILDLILAPFDLILAFFGVEQETLLGERNGRKAFHRGLFGLGIASVLIGLALAALWRTAGFGPDGLSFPMHLAMGGIVALLVLLGLSTMSAARRLRD